jgi:hypothetical protein
MGDMPITSESGPRNARCAAGIGGQKSIHTKRRRSAMKPHQTNIILSDSGLVNKSIRHVNRRKKFPWDKYVYALCAIIAFSIVPSMAITDALGITTTPWFMYFAFMLMGVLFVMEATE